MMSATDLFGGLSSDDDSFLVEKDEKPATEPMKTAAQALLMDFDLSSDDDDEEASKSQKSWSISPLKEEEKPTPMSTTQTLMMDFEMSSDDDEYDQKPHSKQSSISPIEQKPVKFFLPSDEDSQDMPNVDGIQKLIKDGSDVFKMSPESVLDDSEDVKCVEIKKSPPSESPPLKKPKIEPEEDKFEAVFDAVLGNKPTVTQKKKCQEKPRPKMTEMERKMIKIEEKDYVTEAESQKIVQEQYGPQSSQSSNNCHDEIHSMKNQVLLSNMSKEQFDRYLAFRSSSFPKSKIFRLMKEYTNNAKLDPKLVMAMAGLAKVVVGELVEEALDLREAVEGEESEGTGPLQPHHIRQAYLKLSREGKL